MYVRLLTAPPAQSFFLFGPRGTGKTAWLRERFHRAPFFDLLDSATYTELLAAPRRLEDRIPAKHRGWIIIDEIQRVPELLNEVHRLIEARRLKFVMTGSSARKLRARRINLLAGRALLSPLCRHAPLARARRRGAAGAGETAVGGSAPPLGAGARAGVQIRRRPVHRVGDHHGQRCMAS